MTKTIKKIDIHGNETWQEVYVCNRCKRTLDEDEYVYTTKWQSWFPVKPKGVIAAGFAQGSNPDIHICEKCNQAVQDFWNGKDLERIESPDWQERFVAGLKEGYKTWTSEQLRKKYYNVMCSIESGRAIKEIMEERGENL